MKYSMIVHEFSFNKIKSGNRKIGVHLLDKKAQQIKLHDVLEMHNSSTGEELNCEVTVNCILTPCNMMPIQPVITSCCLVLTCPSCPLCKEFV